MTERICICQLDGNVKIFVECSSENSTSNLIVAFAYIEGWTAFRAPNNDIRMDTTKRNETER